MDTTHNTDYYDQIMKTSTTESVVALCVLLILFLGAITLLLWHFIGLKKDEKDASSPEELFDVKKDQKKAVVYTVFILFLFCYALPTFTNNVQNCVYDMNNKAYVWVEGDFVVESATYGWGRFADDVYTLTYEKGEQMISVDISTKQCAVSTGKYTNAVLIYSSRSKIVLALEGIPTNIN